MPFSPTPLDNSKIAKVIDKQHPLGGLLVKVGEKDTNGLYPLTVIDEPWHSGYAREEQLQFVEETS